MRSRRILEQTVADAQTSRRRGALGCDLVDLGKDLKLLADELRDVDHLHRDWPGRRRRRGHRRARRSIRCDGRWRGEALVRLLPVLEDALGAVEPNSEGTTRWLALALALKDLYGIREQTLGELLRSTTVRK